MQEDIVIPVSVFLMVFAIVYTVSAHRYRMRKVVQAERMRSMELRIPLQPEPQRTSGNPFIMPFLMLGAGLGLMLLYLECYNSGNSEGQSVSLAFGSIMMLGGLGWLAAIRFNRPARERMERLAELESQAYVEALERMRDQPPVPPTPPTPSSRVEVHQD